jgi:hypothetical protein
MCNLADLFDLAKLIGHQRGQVHIPWIRLAQDQEDFIHGDYRPELITIAEPTRMRLGEKKTLIEFWLNRQNDPSVEHAFLFRAYPSGDDWIAHEYCPKRISGKQDGGGKKDKEKRKEKSKETKNTNPGRGRQTSPNFSDASGDEVADPGYEDEEDSDGEDHRPGSNAAGNLDVPTRKGKKKAMFPRKKEARKREAERTVADDGADRSEYPPMPDEGHSLKHRVGGLPVDGNKPTYSLGSRPVLKNTPETSKGEPEWGRQPPTVERIQTAGRSSEMAREPANRQGACFRNEPARAAPHVKYRASQESAEGHYEASNSLFSGRS